MRFRPSRFCNSVNGSGRASRQARISPSRINSPGSFPIGPTNSGNSVPSSNVREKIRTDLVRDLEDTPDILSVERVRVRRSGSNYFVDVTTDYRDTGPEGPGYYRQNGSSLEKLEPGRAD